MSVLNKINDAFDMDYYSLKNVFADGDISYNKVHNSNSSDNDIIEFGNYQREYIETGFDNWRAVIKKFNQTSVFKLICVDTSKTNIHSYSVSGRNGGEERYFIGNDKPKYELLLFDIQNDIYEENNLIFDNENREIAQYLHKLLPATFCGGNQITLDRVGKK